MKSIKNTILIIVISLFTIFSTFSQEDNCRKGMVYAKVKQDYLAWFSQNESEVLDVLSINGVTSYKSMISHLTKDYPNKESKTYHEFCKIYEIHFNPSLSVAEQVIVLEATGLFETVEPAYIFDILMGGGYQPNDPLADSTLGVISGLSQLIIHDFYKAWTVEKGDTNLVIGVIDTGCNFDQEDSKGNLAINYADPIDGINNDKDLFDGDSLTDNYRGWDLGDHDNDPTNGPGARHGADMISVIASTPNNDTGMVGTGFNCKYLPIKAAPDSSSNSIFQGYVGMLYAAEQGVKVMNCSWGGKAILPQIFEDLTETILLDYDAVIVSAAGNENNESVYYPASYERVLSVSGLEVDSSKVPASNYNYHVDLAAAGYLRLANGFANDQYRMENGTSVAAAVVSGMAGLVRSHFPEMTAIQARRQMLITADYIDDMDSLVQYAGKMGKRINPYKALTDTISPGLEPFNFVVNNGVKTIDKAGDIVGLDYALVNLLRPSNAVSYKISAVTDNFKVIDSLGVLPDLATWDTLHTVTSPVNLEFFATEDASIECIGRIDFEDATGYKDHTYFFFQMEPTEVTRVNNKQLDQEIAHVFPNPFSDKIFVRPLGNIESIELLNARGEQMSSSVDKNGETFMVTPKQTLESGVYFIRVVGEQGSSTLKTLKIAK